jgi:hypothetical protein
VKVVICKFISFSEGGSDKYEPEEKLVSAECIQIREAYYYSVPLYAPRELQ